MAKVWRKEEVNSNRLIVANAMRNNRASEAAGPNAESGLLNRLLNVHHIGQVGGFPDFRRFQTGKRRVLGSWGAGMRRGSGQHDAYQRKSLWQYLSR